LLAAVQDTVLQSRRKSPTAKSAARNTNFVFGVSRTINAGSGFLSKTANFGISHTLIGDLFMKYATISSPQGSARTRIRNAVKEGLWWAKFGNDTLVYSADKSWADASRAAVADSAPSLQSEGDIRKGDMHVVVQKGRTFQQAFPDIRVILDKGRFLVVEVTKARAKTLCSDDEVCFAIMPLAENSIVFDAPAPSRDRSARAETADVVATLSETSFTLALAHLVSFTTRLSISQSYQNAADWAESELAGMGYAARQETVNVPGPGSSANVVATKQGTGGARQLVIAVAHLDSVNHPGGPAAPAPGADDNGSGSAGILTLAAAMAGHSFEHDVMFILFGGEEQGLHGSTQFVAALPATDKTRVKAVLNMDMIGHVNTTPQTVLLEGAALSQNLIDGLAAAAAEFTGLAVQTSLNPFASDHVPFLNDGVPAVLTIEGADNANDAIHTGADTLDRVDPGFAMEILRMNAGFLAEQAGVVAVAQPGTGAPCGCGDDAPSEAARLLAHHYQALMAQYARLGATGQLQPHDVAAWQDLRAQHDLLMS